MKSETKSLYPAVTLREGFRIRLRRGGRAGGFGLSGAVMRTPGPAAALPAGTARRQPRSRVVRAVFFLPGTPFSWPLGRGTRGNVPMSADGTRDWKSSAPPVRRRPPETDGAADQTDAAMIRFACPACRKTLKSPPGTAGTKAVCPKCGQKVRVPGSNKTTLGLPVLEEIPASADAPAIPASPDDADAAAYAPLPADDPTPDNAGGRVCGILSCVFGGVAALSARPCSASSALPWACSASSFAKTKPWAPSASSSQWAGCSLG